LLLVIGILFAYCTGFTRNILLISCLCGIPPLIFGISISFLPESPLFYMIKDKEELARKAMRYYRGPDFDIEPEIEAFQVGSASAEELESEFAISTRVLLIIRY